VTKRVALAYSGGLDTSVAIGWLGIELGYEVIAVAVDVGQDVDFEELRERASAAGAVEVVVVDAREELVNDFAMPALAANALYEGRYPLVSALSRPAIARHLVAAARQHGASAVAHGATGKGNDQVRFEVATRALAPDLEILAPARSWGMSREATIDYAQKHDIAVTVSKDRIYSIDANIWGRSIECGVLEDPWVAPPEDVYELTVPVADQPVEVTIGFEQGLPVSLDGVKVPPVELVERIGAIAGSVGFGRIDIVEGRRVGIKSREIYECPAALALIMAHADLESLTLERDVAHEKARLEPRFALPSLPTTGCGSRLCVRRCLRSWRRHNGVSLVMFGCALAPEEQVRSSAGAVRSVCTCGTLRPMTPMTHSITRTLRALCVCGAWGSRLGRRVKEALGDALGESYGCCPRKCFDGLHGKLELRQAPG